MKNFYSAMRNGITKTKNYQFSFLCKPLTKKNQTRSLKSVSGKEVGREFLSWYFLLYIFGTFDTMVVVFL